MILAAAASFSIGAGAATLTTAPALSGWGTNGRIYCDIVNVGKKPMTYTIEIHKYDGTILTDPQPLTGSLQPGAGTALGDVNGDGVYCKFITNRPASSARAVAVYDNGAAYMMAIPAQ
ncbi:MAG: hypothetical protein FIA97_13895 [Methylococcaceae bacterium]|nr:hypothetical protein [Methylococcaceae bacterium]